jgi:hypothetical protein
MASLYRLDHALFTVSASYNTAQQLSSLEIRTNQTGFLVRTFLNDFSCHHGNHPPLENERVSIIPCTSEDGKNLENITIVCKDGNHPLDVKIFTHIHIEASIDPGVNEKYRLDKHYELIRLLKEYPKEHPIIPGKFMESVYKSDFPKDINIREYYEKYWTPHITGSDPCLL